jgi:hypothetical protein
MENLPGLPNYRPTVAELARGPVFPKEEIKDLCPPVSKSLVAHLATLFPQPTVRPGVDTDSLMFRSGAASVISYLAQIYSDQEETF